MKKGQSILGILFFALLFGLCFQQNALNVEAKTRVIHKDITPKEAASSDLKVIKKVTKLAAHRWIQSYTMDSKYYYYNKRCQDAEPVQSQSYAHRFQTAC